MIGNEARARRNSASSPKRSLPFRTGGAQTECGGLAAFSAFPSGLVSSRSQRGLAPFASGATPTSASHRTWTTSYVNAQRGNTRMSMLGTPSGNGMGGNTAGSPRITLQLAPLPGEQSGSIRHGPGDKGDALTAVQNPCMPAAVGCYLLRPG